MAVNSKDYKNEWWDYKNSRIPGEPDNGCSESPFAFAPAELYCSGLGLGTPNKMCEREQNGSHVGMQLYVVCRRAVWGSIQIPKAQNVLLVKGPGFYKLCAINVLSLDTNRTSHNPISFESYLGKHSESSCRFLYIVNKPVSSSFSPFWPYRNNVLVCEAKHCY